MAFTQDTSTVTNFGKDTPGLPDLQDRGSFGERKTFFTRTTTTASTASRDQYSPLAMPAPAGADTDAASTRHIALFQSVLHDFNQDMKDKLEVEFPQFATVESVYQEIEKTQKEQSKSGSLRAMKRIRPFLDCLNQFTAALNTIVQMKPDVLGAIWGPLQVIIQISKNYFKGFDKAMETTITISNALPRFHEFSDIFADQKSVLEILCMFYRDILDFLAILIEFFHLKGWRVFFDALWPKYAEKLKVVLDNIDHHNRLMSVKTTLIDLREAREARNRALAEFELNRESREKQGFETCRAGLSPILYDKDLVRLLDDCTKGTCGWLWTDGSFQRWLNNKSKGSSVFWLSGMPGAGKSHIAASIVSNLQQRNETIAFAFLSYQDQERVTVLDVMLSLIFQVLFSYPRLRPVLQRAYDECYRELQADIVFVRNLLVNLIKCCGSTYLILDGLDELKLQDRGALLRSILDLSLSCNDLKIFLSSRSETDISELLQTRAIHVPVEDKNNEDIKSVFRHLLDDWLNELEDNEIIEEQYRSEIENLTRPVPEKANGMFLYVRLVLQHLKSKNTLYEIIEEAGNLPEGLDQAYGRILKRINELPPNEKLYASRTLEWIACSKVRLRKQEVIQALTVSEGDRSIDHRKRPVRDLAYYCGPIIEFQGDFIQFVHFTAKDYLSQVASGPWLKPEANIHIARTCMNYLMLDCNDPDLQNEEIQRGITNGSYTLQAYAMSFWLDHIKRGVTGLEGTLEFNLLHQKIDEFLTKRKRPDMKDPKEMKRVVLDLKPFMEEYRKTYEWLRVINEAMTAESEEQSKTNEKKKKDDQSAPLAPLTKAWKTCQEEYERSLSTLDQHPDSTMHEELERYYGSDLYKCNRYMCNWSRIGFQSKVRRDRHVQSHMRSFKCGFGSCPYTKIGFFSQAQLNQHIEIKHIDFRLERATNQVVHEITGTTLEKAILDALEMEIPDLLAGLLDEAKDINLNLLMCIAYLKGLKVSILQVLLDKGASADDRSTLDLISTVSLDDHWLPPHLIFAIIRVREEVKISQSSSSTRGASDGPQTALTAAIDGGSISTIDWLLIQKIDVNEKLRDTTLEITALDYLCRRQQVRCADRQARRPFPLEIMRLLLDQGVDVSDGRALYHLVQCAFLPEEEPAYVEAARLMVENGATFKSDMLHYLVPNNFSVALARLAVENGANLDAEFMRETPLSRALKGVQKKKKAAEFARFLVEGGAQKIPELGSGGRMDRRKFKSWAKVEWDELLRVTRHLRPQDLLNVPTTEMDVDWQKP